MKLNDYLLSIRCFVHIECLTLPFRRVDDQAYFLGKGMGSCRLCNVGFHPVSYNVCYILSIHHKKANKGYSQEILGNIIILKCSALRESTEENPCKV